MKLMPVIVAAEGFTVNAEKTRILRAGRRQAITGVVVNKAMGLSRQSAAAARRSAPSAGGA
jgi:hypothetical protein